MVRSNARQRLASLPAEARLKSIQIMVPLAINRIGAGTTCWLRGRRTIVHGRIFQKWPNAVRYRPDVLLCSPAPFRLKSWDALQQVQPIFLKTMDRQK